MISFSGIDCAGKSTQIDFVKKCLDESGILYCVIWSRGGYSSWVETIKKLFRKKNKDKSFEEMRLDAVVGQSKKAKLLLWVSICDLIRYYGIVFRWIEKRGTLILCDRYIWDTYVDFSIKYPGVNFENWIVWKLLIRLIKKPDCSILFTIPAEESMRRSELKKDLHSEPAQMRNDRILIYERLIRDGKWQYVIDSMQNIENVSAHVRVVLVAQKVLEL